MLLPSWALFTVCAVLGVAGLLAAYRKPWTIALAFVAMLSISIVSIVQLRDPLGLSVAQRREAESWSYVAAVLVFNCRVHAASHWTVLRRSFKKSDWTQTRIARGR